MQDNTLDDFLYWTTYICIIMFHIIGLEILICIPIYYAIFKRNKFYILDFTIKILFILIMGLFGYNVKQLLIKYI
jgi:hypothetical protein